MEHIDEIEIWKKKLLDLGKQNNLLNFREGKSATLEVLSPRFGDAYTRVLTHGSVTIYDVPITRQEEDDALLLFDEESLPPNSREGFYARYERKVPQTQLLLFNPYQPARKILKALKRRAEESVLERGVNILYLAFGFLAWRESDSAHTVYKAPIVLLPITLSNPSASEPFQVRRFDEDPIVNPTLSYMVEQQYGIRLPPLEDLSIEAYLDLLRERFERLGWEILPEARIATFSFNKLNMYLDLQENARDIADNPNVSALTAAESNDSEVFLNREDVEEVVSSSDLFLKQHNVVDADFSQAEAIEYALRGKSFVLQGPPGTGKSQTITNMIAELLYAGKKVLFVSEKMAALEVVYGNLRKAGLSDFCLELHSYKANKKDFVDGLYETLMHPRTLVGEKAIDNRRALDQATEKLNSYVEALHRKREPLGMSLRQLIAAVNHLQSALEIPYLIPDIRDLSLDDLKARLSLFTRYRSLESTLGYDFRAHGLYGLKADDSSYAFKVQLSKDLQEASIQAGAAKQAIERLSQLCHLRFDSVEKAKEYLRFARDCRQAELFDPRLNDASTQNNLAYATEEALRLVTKIGEKEAKIRENYEESVFSERLDDLLAEYITSGASMWGRLTSGRYKRAHTLFCSHRLDKKKVSYQQALDDLMLLKHRAQDLRDLDTAVAPLRALGFMRLQGNAVDYQQFGDDLHRFRLALRDHPEYASGDLNALTLPSIEEIERCLLRFEEQEQTMKPYLVDSMNLDESPNGREELYGRFLSSLDDLDAWTSFSLFYEDLRKANVLAFLELFLSGNHPLEQLQDAYRLCFYRQWIDAIFREEPELRVYNRFLHEADIEAFCASDTTELRLARAEIAEKLSATRPDPMLQMAGSPAGILLREHEKKRKLKPIRALMHEIPSFIQSIKPCFLMSPLSVSTFLPSDMRFDVTIFDEASQVFPEDAIVAVYRSKQLIVVGDSKQMPPTKFFMASESGEDEYDEEASDIDSYESILDLCSTTFPTKSLLCHYRSRDESLIQFSNQNFYRFNLFTYPGVHGNRNDLGVEFVYLPQGIMESKSKINRLEAQKIVDLVFEHFRNHPDRSLGVVAFNIKQQEAILRLLDRRRALDPSLEAYFRSDVEEPFFVKNLETVQGDERDTILFSIAYAKNEKGTFALRFGPLGLQGGERRLNVAITRAKLNVKVVSSIRSSDIDLSRVTNLGPKLLHDYLHYAEHRHCLSIQDNEAPLSYESESLFEDDVQSFLQASGFDVTRQVGHSRDRVDLGLKKPGTEDYVLAIECDGQGYRDAKSARDRDRLRQGVLQRMDWRYYRVWSTDWFRNRAQEQAALLKACQAALSEADTPNATRIEPLNVEELITSAPATGSVRLYDEYTPYLGDRYQDFTYLATGFTEAEGPLSLEFFLRQTCTVWGYGRVTTAFRDAFMEDFSFHVQRLTLEDGFLYCPGQKNLAMRKDLGKILGDVRFISDYELRNGMYAAIEANQSCRKDELFAFIRDQLGFTRTGENMSEKFESAFALLCPYIVIGEDGMLSLRRDKTLELHHRENR